MANTKYPAGIKVKAPLAWVGGMAVGVSPFIFYWSTYLIKEHFNGRVPRQTYGEDRVFHTWMQSAYRHPVQLGEFLRAHPQHQYSTTDKKRLRINELENMNRY